MFNLFHSVFNHFPNFFASSECIVIVCTSIKESPILEVFTHLKQPDVIKTSVKHLSYWLKQLTVCF